MTGTDARRFDVLCMGRSCLDLYAHETGVRITGVRSFDAYVGGCPTNVSVGTRRLGLRTALLTAVGADDVGDFVLDFLAREDVDTSASPRLADRRTSAALVTIITPEQFTLTYYRENSADLALTIEHVDRAPLAESRLVFLTGTGLCGNPSRTATIHAAAAARALGAIVVVDIDYRGALWPDHAAFGAAVRTLLPHVDFAIGTAAEVGAAAGDHECEATAAERLFDFGLRAVVLKRGGEGAVVYRRGADAVTIPAYRVAVVNVLGAGDAFASGFIYGVLHGWSLDESVRIGNATGAIVATRHGCANFMPTLPEVRAFVSAADGHAPLAGIA